MPLVVILVAFFVISLIYSWATPPLEASDELWHFGMVNFIAETGQLPVQQPDVKTAYEQEGSQPPLYYTVAALLVKGIDRSDFDAVRSPNPHVVAGVPGYFGNKNLVLHDSLHPPLESTVLAIYVIRLFSVLLGCITITSIYMSARLVRPEWTLLPAMAASLVAFNPMFLFISASVNNDNLVTALNSLVIWQLVVLMRRRSFSVAQSVGVAALVALASLSKLSGLVLLPFAGLAGLWIFVRPLVYQTKERLDWRGLGLHLVMLAGVWAIVAGWWYYRNLTLYGELFGTRMMVAVAGPRVGVFTFQTLLDEFQGFRFAYWALFGAVNIMTFRWFYDVMDAVSLVMVAGMLTACVSAVRARLHSISDRRWLDDWVIYGILCLMVSIGTVSVVVWTSQTYASQGRLLFPFNGAIAILGASGIVYLFRYGIRQLLPSAMINWLSSQRISIWYVMPMVFAGFATVVPLVSIAPEYAPPPALTQIPASAQSVYARFGDFALVGYEVPDKRYFPDDDVPVTVYWKVDKASSIDYSLYLHATLDDGSAIGKVDSYPGAGRLRTSKWQSGAIYADQYVITLDSMSRSVSELRLQVGWWDYASRHLVEAVDQNGQPLASVMLDAGGFAPLEPTQSSTVLIPIEPLEFGEAIELIGYELKGDLLSLQWRAKAPIPSDNTVFVQALDANNHVVGQGDAPPKLATRYWQIGEQFVTEHTIVKAEPIPSGTYRIVLGWYNPSDLTRLSAAYQDNAFTLPVLFVVP